MKFITSRNNPLYREIRQLSSSSQARRKLARTILDGVHLCQSYLEYMGGPLFCVVNESSQNNVEIAEIIADCQKKKCPVILLPDDLYEGISQVEEGVGVQFIIEQPVYPLPAFLEPSGVLLDRIQDPGNLGSILRSAAAAGIQAVFCSEGTAVAWSPRVLRAGMGAHFLLRIYENVDLSKLMDNFAITVAATMPGAEKSIYDFDLKQPLFWLFGHEGQGVSEALQAQTNIKLNVPHAGKQESLNVAACAAVCFFEQLRQKMQG